MHRSRILFSVLLVLLAASASFAQGKKAAESSAAGVRPNTWYSQAVSRGRAGINVTNFWSLGPRLRAETVVGGHKIITIVNGSTYYAFDALGMNGVAIERAESAIEEDSKGRRPFGNEIDQMVAQGAEKVREEVVLGKNCDVYQVTDSIGRRVLWVSKDQFALPVRIEIYDRRSGEKKHTDFLDWTNGMPIAESFFDPQPAVNFARYSLKEYIHETQTKGPVGSVPVLYADLLHGRPAQ